MRDNLNKMPSGRSYISYWYIGACTCIDWQVATKVLSDASSGRKLISPLAALKPNPTSKSFLNPPVMCVQTPTQV